MLRENASMSTAVVAEDGDATGGGSRRGLGASVFGGSPLGGSVLGGSPVGGSGVGGGALGALGGPGCRVRSRASALTFASYESPRPGLDILRDYAVPATRGACRGTAFSMNMVSESRPRRGRASEIVAAAAKTGRLALPTLVLAVGLGACSSTLRGLPTQLGGMPAGTPQQPAPAAYPAVHDMPPPRPDVTLPLEKKRKAKPGWSPRPGARGGGR